MTTKLDTMQKYDRHSMRLKRYDYTSKGFYSVTICTFDRMCLFGNVLNGGMILNDLGKIVQDEWHRSAIIRNEIQLDEFVVMPNHIHGIISINSTVGATRRVAPTSVERPHVPVSGSIGAIIGQFKSKTAKQINILRKTPNLPIWQRNYGSTSSPSLEPSRAKARDYEHIVRNEGDLNKMRQYIIDNPLNWDKDEENPNNLKTRKNKCNINTI